MEVVKQRDQAQIIGTVTIRRHPAGTHDKWRELMAAGKVDEAKALIASGEVHSVTHNLIMQSANHGRDIIIQKLVAAFTGSDPYTLHITHGEIGTGSTTPQLTDTGLTTPTNRVALTYGANSGSNTAILQFFFTDSALANGTYRECGTFIDGSASIGTGQIFNHALFSTPYTKAAGTDTTVEVDIAIP